MERFARVAAEHLQKLPSLQGTPFAPEASDLETPPKPEMGDFGFPCFKLAKPLRLGPPQVAQKLLAELQAVAPGGLPHGIVAEAAGPYVNFRVPGVEVARALLTDILKGDGLGGYGSGAPDSRGTWVLEYSSPNVAKPLNFYHVRTTALGAALDRVGRYRGFKVISINHLGDWGKQYGYNVAAWRRYASELQGEATMKDLVEMYVRINKAAESDPAIEVEAKAAFVALEKGDPEVTALWQKFRDISLKEYARIYGRLGVKFDHIWGESFYTPQLVPLLDGLRAKGTLVESEGAWIVPVTDREGREIPPCILLKGDGATIYATRDVAAAQYRMEKFHFDRMTYIVGGEQRLHFQQVFGVLRKMGLDWEKRCEHVPTGLYRFKDAKMSTRKGNFFTLEDVLEDCKARVNELMTARLAAPTEHTPKFSREEFESTAEAIAVGAVVYFDLHTDPARDVEFDLERVVDFEGETGPYLQYAHTRCLSILRKAGAGAQGLAEGALPADELAKLAARVTTEPERQLLSTLGQFPLHLERTLRFAKASQLCNYLIDVTRAFGVFYRECRVLPGEAAGSPDAELSRARLALVEATRRVLGRGLALMGIPRPEKM